MHLVFSWFADAGAWPEHPGAECAVLDQEVVGPLRLLDHVETMLGLGRPDVAAVRRIAVYRQKIEAAGAGRFWSESFEVDPWSATRELLGWRDELVEAGWRPPAGQGRSRLADLAAAEEAGPDLPHGRSDRLRAAIDALGEPSNLPLRSISLVDARSALPAGWQALLDALERRGTVIEQMPEPPPIELGRQGSLTLLVADTELAAAEALAGWLAAGPEDNEEVTFVFGKDTALLDHALARSGLPRLGHSAKSAHRALLQVLPLAFALAWEPPDPNRLLDFLLLPISPLRRSAANRLAKVVAENPGVGGDAWLAAWDEIDKKLAEEEGDDPNKRASRVAGWREFVEPERHNPKTGMPRAVAKGIADRVSAWASSRSATNGDPLFLSLSQIASELSGAIDATGIEMLDRVLVERMIEQSLGDGDTDPASVAEAAPWRSVSHPGAVWGEANTVVWWHFADPGEASAAARWNELERAALSEAGCPLDEPEIELRRLSAAWERPLRHARDRLLLVRPTLAGGVETTAHPLWHSLVARNSKIAEEISVRAENVLHGTSPAFAGRTLARSPVALVPPPELRPEWAAPAGKVRPREFESPSSLATLLTCPFQWTLKYASGLRPGVRQSLPEIEKLVGIVAHRIAQEAFPPGAPPRPGAVESFAARRFEELLPLVAATLLLPGAASELAAARRSVPPALAELARFLEVEKLTVVGVEDEFSVADTLVPGTGVGGRIDMRAATAEGRQVVIDLKWHRTEKYVRSDLKLGTALQIAAYARHVSDERIDVSAGYYMLRQRRFLASEQLRGGSATVIAGQTPKETWEKTVSSVGSALDDFGAGRVRAAFEHNGKKVETFSDPYLLLLPKCGRCDFVGICGVNS
jgi:hypothetical protein